MHKEDGYSEQHGGSARRVAIALRVDLPYADHGGVFGGVQRYALRQPNWKCMFDMDPSNFDPHMRRSSRRLKREGYDGVIGRATSGKLATNIRGLRKLGVPFVSTVYANRDPETPGVFIDAEKCGELAADHLMDRGFRRLAFLGLKDMAMSDDMGKGFFRAAEDLGRACEAAYFDAGHHMYAEYWFAGKKDFEPFLDRLTPPFGLFVMVPWAARMMVSLCENRGWNVPRDVAVVATDMLKGPLDFTPQITYVGAGHERVGYRAAAMLDRLMNGEQPEQMHVIIPPDGVEARESTDYFAVEDEVVAEALRFISEHLREKLTVDRVADELTVSAKTLQRRFENTMGRSMSAEVRRLRLEMAKRLLRDGDLQVGEVAKAAGFGSRFTLIDVFRRGMGVTPIEYRKSQINSGPK